MDTKKYKEILLERQNELIDRSQKSESSREPVELDQTRQGRLSRQDALMQQAMQQATDNNRQIEIKRIKAALKRIDSNDFGYCAICDEEISEPRLNNDPVVHTCIKCAE